MYAMLQLMVRGGLLKDVVHHPAAVSLTRFVTYKPDFRAHDLKRDILIYIEFKGFLGERFRVIKNLWREFGQTPLQIWMKKNNRIYMAEEIGIGKFEVKEK